MVHIKGFSFVLLQMHFIQRKQFSETNVTSHTAATENVVEGPCGPRPCIWNTVVQMKETIWISITNKWKSSIAVSSALTCYCAVKDSSHMNFDKPQKNSVIQEQSGNRERLIGIRPYRQIHPGEG